MSILSDLINPPAVWLQADVDKQAALDAGIKFSEDAIKPAPRTSFLQQAVDEQAARDAWLNLPVDAIKVPAPRKSIMQSLD